MKVLTSVLLVTFALSCPTLGQTSQAASEQFRAFWADSVAGHDGLKTPIQVDQLVADAKRANVNAILAQVWRRGGALFLKTGEPRYEDSSLAPGFDVLQYLLDKAHAQGIEVHAWLNALAIWGGSTPPLDPRHVYNLHGPGKSGADYWLSRSDAGAESGTDGIFLDPGNPAAADYVARLCIDLVRNYDVDGIHLDFIRYEGQEWGFNPTSIDRFNVINKRTGIPAKNDAQWMEWRREQVTALARRVYLNVGAIKPKVKVSAATIAFGDGPVAENDWLKTSAYSSVFQDWRAWTQDGILDFPVVMNYDRETDANQKVWFDRWIEWDKNHRYNRQIVIGQGAFLNSIPDSIAQTRRALASSSAGNLADGVAFFSYWTTNGGSVPNGEFYSALSTPSANDPNPVFASFVPTPKMTWKTDPVRGLLLGRIVYPNGEPVDGAKVFLASPLACPACDPKPVQTDGNGFYGWAELLTVLYSMSVQVDGKTVNSGIQIRPPAGVVTELDIVLDELPAPAITAASYSKKVLAVVGKFFGPGAQLEINGRLLDQETIFDNLTSTLSVRGKRKKLGLSDDVNRVVVIMSDRRSEPFTF
jgi:uncharacterized lipoprotein YddW (UPF0748 family)